MHLQKNETWVTNLNQKLNLTNVRANWVKSVCINTYPWLPWLLSMNMNYVSGEKHSMECEARHSVRFWWEEKSSLCARRGAEELCVCTEMWLNEGFKWQEGKVRPQVVSPAWILVHSTCNTQSSLAWASRCVFLKHTYTIYEMKLFDATFSRDKEFAPYITSLTKSALPCFRFVLPNAVNAITIIQSDVLPPQHAALCCPTLTDLPPTAPRRNPATLTW